MSQLRELTLVRHGETVGESSIRYHGITDVDLSDLGRAQMASVARALGPQRFDAVYTSPLRRTLSAAAIIAPNLPSNAIPDFVEINFGHWEGMTREEIAARDPELYRVWIERAADFTYPGGDSVTFFRRRVSLAFRGLLPTLPEHTLVIAHKGVIASILADVLELTPQQRSDWPIDLASIHVLQHEGGSWQSRSVNVTEHLE